VSQNEAFDADLRRRRQYNVLRSHVIFPTVLSEFNKIGIPLNGA